jgi:hypothetical protein
MTTAPAITYVWLYLAESTDQGAGEGEVALAQLAHALSIPSQQVFAGDVVQINDRLPYMQASTLVHFPVRGDFAHSCDIQLTSWTQAAVEAALDKLSTSGLTVAMLDDNDASPFACILFQAGRRRAVTVVGDDDTDMVTIYPANRT